MTDASEMVKRLREIAPKRQNSVRDGQAIAKAADLIEQQARELQEARELLTTGLEYLECVTHYDMRAPLFAKQNDAKWVKTVDAFLSRGAG